LQARAGHHAVAVGNARARAFQSLNESRNVDVRREVENHMHVVPHDPKVDDAGSMTARDLG